MKPIDALDGDSAIDWILVHTAARHIGCSPRSVRRYIWRGTLTAIRRGKRAWLVKRSDVLYVATYGRERW